MRLDEARSIIPENKRSKTKTALDVASSSRGSMIGPKFPRLRMTPNSWPIDDKLALAVCLATTRMFGSGSWPVLAQDVVEVKCDGEPRMSIRAFNVGVYDET